MNETMGQIIRRLRKERNLTQEELAEQLNITYQAVSRWENGTGMPDISQILPLSNVFGVTTDVLFGKDGTNGEEIVESFIKDTHKKHMDNLKGMTNLECVKECCEDILKMLEIYPNNYKLLDYSLGVIDELLDEYAEINENEEIKKWRNESIRQANVILGHCTDSYYINRANKWMACCYSSMGNYTKMLEYAEKLPVFDSFTDGGRCQADALRHLGKTEESRRITAKNIEKAIDYLDTELLEMGRLWRDEGKIEEAYACHRLYPAIYELIVGGRDGEERTIFPPRYAYERCAVHCMNMDRADEAMDWLKKMVKHERVTAKNFNMLTETQIPYLYGLTIYSSTQPYQRKDTLLPSFAYSVFDPIRENDRFKAILSDAEAFEKEE